jgi:capsular exopolysaccharide synthesis family protein
MSQIFDALHRSEGERHGIGPHKFTAAPDLLEAAERQRAQSPPEGKHELSENGGEQFGSALQSTRVLVPSLSKLLCMKDEERLVAEKFRFLGVRLRHLQQKRPFKRLLITSSVPEEGKSTIAANLACTLARRKQQKVLLLDGDFRRPTLEQQLGLGKLPGLHEVLEAGTSPAMVICRLGSLGFFILPAGAPAADPLALLQSEKLPIVMDLLSSWFDWIVIDSPPVLPLGDTSVWMRLTDAILLVTRPGRISRRQLQQCLEVIEQPKLLGAVVNGSTEAMASGYYYYHGGGQFVPTTSDQPR